MNIKNLSKNQKITIAVVVLVFIGLIYNTFFSLNSLLKKGEMYQKIGKTALALDVYRKAISIHPYNYQAHLHLGRALLESDEIELAKQELSKAVELSNNFSANFDAQIEMSKLLVAEKNFKDAEKVLLSVNNPKPTEIKKALADLYIHWGNEVYNSGSKIDSISKYKNAWNYYKSFDIQEQKRIQYKVITFYEDMAMNFLAQNKETNAIEALKQSIAFIDNPSSHIKLAEIYKKQNKTDEAVAEYQKAYGLDTTGSAPLYLSELLIQKGMELASKNDFIKARKFFEQAQEINPSIIVPAEILYSVLLSSIKAALVSDKETNKIYPEISFTITNRGNQNVNLLRAKAVFFDSGNSVGEDEKLVVTSDKPLKAKTDSDKITLSLASGIDNTKKSNLLQVKVYLSCNNESDWKFTRTLTISNKKRGSSNSNVTSTYSQPKSIFAKAKNNTAKETKITHTSTSNTEKATPHTGTNTSTPISPAQPVPVPVQVQPNNNNNVELPPM